MTVKTKDKVGVLDAAHFKKYYEDEYASITFVESVPCIKMKVTGVPQSSDHYQLVHAKVVQSIQMEKDNYCRLHLMTDHSKAGMVLPEDLAYYHDQILPPLEKCGIRYHAVILPESKLVRSFFTAVNLATKKIHVEYFNTVNGAAKWLRHH